MSTIKNDLRTWVAANLILGNDISQLVNRLVELGYSKEAAEQEIEEANSHPYVAAGRQVQHKLQRRDSLLKTVDSLKRQVPEYLRIEKIPLPPYKEFLQTYYFQNRPGLFSGGVDHWKARDWTFPKIVEAVGYDTLVEIQFDREKDPHYEVNNVQHRRQIEFGRFIEMVQSVEASNNFYLTANNTAFANSKIKVLLQDTGNIGDYYLNPQALGQGTHLWIGPKGTITPLHHDLTNNLFVQVIGKKKFRMIPAFQVPYLYNDFHVFSRVDLLNVDLDRHPLFKRVTIVDIDVEAGDTLFIPIGGITW